MHKLDTDAAGNIITRPVTGWSTHTAAGVAVIAAINYVETPEQLEKGDNKVIQLVLTPAQCLELAETLTTAANKLLQAIPPNTTLH